MSRGWKFVRTDALNVTIILNQEQAPPVITISTEVLE